MSDYIYIIANLKNKENIWMNTTPFIELKDKDNKISLQMIRDISINFLEKEYSVIQFSLYKIKGTWKNFLYKRDNIFKNIDLLPGYAEEIGFEKVNDFLYVVDELNKKQNINGFEINFSYIKDKIFGDKIYLSNPSISFNL